MKKTETYGSVLAEIKALQQLANELRKNELPGVIKRIREAIAEYNLTAGDLGFGNSTAAKNPASGGRGRTAGSRSALQTGVAKYRDPKTGKTWTGRGKPPLWIVGAKDRTPFLIDPASAGEAPVGRRAGRATQVGKSATKGSARGTKGMRRVSRRTVATLADTRPGGGEAPFA